MSDFTLRRAIATIHADAAWLPKLLVHGLLSLTLIGIPFAAGWVMESIDNSRKGFPTPLPPWVDWPTRYLIGLFVLLIDFSFFVLPLIVAGMLAMCMSVLVVGIGIAGFTSLGVIVGFVGLLGGLIFLGSFFCSVAPVGRLIYAEEGRIEQALSLNVLRRALQPPARAVFLAARLRSLFAYLPALLMSGLLYQLAQLVFPAQLLVMSIMLWLLNCTLIYAHLVVAQIYVAAERVVQQRLMTEQWSG